MSHDYSPKNPALTGPSIQVRQPPPTFTCALCNQGFLSLTDYHAHACPEATYTSGTNPGEVIHDTPSAPSAKSAVKNSLAAKSAESAKEIPLAPCPWCKTEPDLTVGDGSVQITCTNHACPVQPHLVQNGSGHESEATARANWNRVTPPPPASESGEVGNALCVLSDKLPTDLLPALQAWVMMRRRKRYPISVSLVAKWSAFLAMHGEAAFMAALVHSTTEEYRALVPAPREAQAPKAAKKGDAHGKGF